MQISNLSAPDATISAEQVEYIAWYVYKNAGIVLGPEKRYLMQGRLTSLCRTAGYASIAELLQALSGKAPQIETMVIDSLTTHETSWFRDQKPFSAMEKVILPRLADSKNNKTLNIWCAACSTGQEAYSIAMLMKEVGLFDGWNVCIHAIDISQKVINQAKTGEYSHLEVGRGLPERYMAKYFNQNGNTWHIKSEIRRMVQFSTFRLNADSYSLGPFDLVFCRNVLIYFDAETKTRILTNIHKTLMPGGLLMIGGSEVILGLDDLYEQVRIQDVTVYANKESHTVWQNVAA